MVISASLNANRNLQFGVQWRKAILYKQLSGETAWVWKRHSCEACPRAWLQGSAALLCYGKGSSVFQLSHGDTLSSVGRKSAFPKPQGNWLMWMGASTSGPLFGVKNSNFSAFVILHSALPSHTQCLCPWTVHICSKLIPPPSFNHPLPPSLLQLSVYFMFLCLWFYFSHYFILFISFDL